MNVELRRSAKGTGENSHNVAVKFAWAQSCRDPVRQDLRLNLDVDDWNSNELVVCRRDLPHSAGVPLDAAPLKQQPTPWTAHFPIAAPGERGCNVTDASQTIAYLNSGRKTGVKFMQWMRELQRQLMPLRAASRLLLSETCSARPRFRPSSQRLSIRTRSPPRFAPIAD